MFVSSLQNVKEDPHTVVDATDEIHFRDSRFMDEFSVSSKN